ncbi:MAG: universal stress protein [Deltaproteobacteria bacterium]|nr:MAG: universal stress protein [Deltaproteobacteria bacterium]
MMGYPKYKKVLFCTDFSENADYAFEFAYGIAKRDEGLLYILHVIPNDPHQAYAETFMGHETLAKIKKDFVADLDKKLKEHYVKKIEAGVKFDIVTRSGREHREHDEILKFARKNRNRTCLFRQRC